MIAVMIVMCALTVTPSSVYAVETEKENLQRCRYEEILQREAEEPVSEEEFEPESPPDRAIPSTNANEYTSHFRVYYDNTTMEQDVAEAVAEEYENIYTYFVTNNSFLKPYYNLATSRYKVYLESRAENAPLGNAYTVGTCGSYIVLGYQNAEKLVRNTDPSYTDAIKGVLANMYMHAIMFRYGVGFSQEWMHKSFASMAGCVYEQDFSALIYDKVNSYLTSTDVTLGNYGVNDPRN